ncbi:hypothetical protein QFC21_005646 [Naganishia friedmannii]|uniref:Uncharacterized protein n=1 Tax=Naganishia friedmannii TaxID=89922 RepID=A0ACC2V8P0_9TREE|nr:hypothetical protein QFC21_005646 [Naganishia friedmannii]
MSSLLRTGTRTAILLRLPPASTVVSRRLYTTEQGRTPSSGESEIEANDQGKAIKTSKICSVPFHFTQADAQSRLNIAALLATATIPNVIYATVLRFLPPLPNALKNFLLELGIGGASVQHISTKAVLWPVWRVRGVWEAQARQVAGKGSRGKVWFAVREGSVPGNSFSPLSLLPFATQQIPSDLPTYDPEIDLAQLTEVGTPEVTAVPFGAYTPFDVFERMRKEAGGRVVQWEGMKVDLERDLDVQMMTAHPIYFPLFIGEFEFTPDQHTENGRKAKSRRITIVMDAHDEDLSPQTMANRSLGGSLAASLGEAFGRWMSPPAIPPYHPENEQGQVDRVMAVYKAPQSPLVAVERDVLEAGVEEVNWADERIQAWSGPERADSEAWIEKGQVRFAMQAQLETMKSLEAQSGSQITTLKLNNSPDRRSVLPSIEKVSMGDAIAQASDDVRKATEEWEEARPAWLKRYEAKRGEAKAE